ncbi:hypothetical protein A8950_2336 [Dongia mobilis]|uniref:Uncharacterized protein n=1 Tax=Dongia mobilis TaxID=578943 RepID=A0A4R6WNK1_9PROT|nr:hypothetical protein [Dongia mobilis]TDQ82513.1 hypothetical protein A8950_2336 [Dongia mobilis]
MSKSTSGSPSGSATGSPSSRQSGTGLAARRAELAAAITRHQAECDAAALRAALGDAAARTLTEAALAKAALLAAEAAALDRAIAADRAAGEAAAARTAAIAGRRAAKMVEAQLAERLRVAGEVERLARRLFAQVERLGGLGAAIDDAIDGNAGAQRLGAAALEGEIPARRFQAPLGMAATGGRLAEFMAGLGFDAFLPLPRPETRAPIDALRAAEASAQEPYRRLCQRLIAEVAS